ncbi:MAG: hypothetical protein AABX04_04755 [Nanoarchaeota archaeon]
MELILTFLEEYEGAEEQFEKGRYKNATILFSKAFFALCDILIFQKIKKLPKNHGERFRILEEFYPPVYLAADKIFSHYIDAYNKPLLKENSEFIQNGIKQIIRLSELPAEIKEVINR